MRKTFVELVKEHAENSPNSVAVVCKEKETTYKELFELVCRYRTFLMQNGVGKGEIVVFRSSQSTDFAVQYLAIHSLSAVVASLEKGISDEGMLSVAGQLGAKLIITDQENGSENGFVFIPRGNVLETAEQYPVTEIDEFPDLEASADILFTTGTTGVSKGVELSHKSLIATAENATFGSGFTSDTAMIVPGPLNHAAGIRKLFVTFYNAGTIIILDGMINIKAFFNALNYGNGKKIAASLVPAAIRTVFQLTRDKIGEYADVIDFIESASAPLPEADRARLCRLLPNTRLYTVYGSSESGTVSIYDYNKNAGKEHCIGKAMPNVDVFIVDDDRKIIKSSPANMGLIACGGDVNMKGYVNEPELTAQAMVDGVVYTNDIGYIDDEGYIYVVGRKGDVINVGGLKVAPTEVEAAALEYDGIADCICIGIDDAISGKAVKLLVVMEAGKKLDPMELKRFFVTKLEAHQVPRFYEAVDEIKRTYNGKLDRKAYQ